MIGDGQCGKVHSRFIDAPLLFGEGWQTNPRLPDHLRAHKPALIFGIGFLLSLIAALMFAIFLGPHPSMQVAVLT